MPDPFLEFALPFHEMLIVSSLQKNLILSNYSRSCGIDLGDFYVTIGGQSLDGNYTGLRMVTKYSKQGQSEDLPQLQTGRYHLGCSSYTDSNGNQVRMPDISITDKKIFCHSGSLGDRRCGWLTSHRVDPVRLD